MEHRNPTAAGPEYFNTAETQEKDPKTGFMKMIEALKGEINKSLKEIQKNRNSGKR